MGNFSAVYVRVEGAEETDLGFHQLGADTLEAALEEGNQLDQDMPRRSSRAPGDG